MGSLKKKMPMMRMIQLVVVFFVLILLSRVSVEASLRSSWRDTQQPAFVLSRWGPFLRSHLCATSRKRSTSQILGVSLHLYQVAVSDAADVLSNDVSSRLSTLVDQRAQARWEGNYTHADVLRDRIGQVQLPHGFEVSIQDFPRKEGGGSSWELLYNIDIPPMEGETVLQLAHSALGLAVSSSE